MPTNRLVEPVLPQQRLTPLPFWAATRQARLERLRATAIEVPEPEVVQLAVGAKAEAAQRYLREIPGLAFDEGFVVSRNLAAKRRLLKMFLLIKRRKKLRAR